MFYNLNNNAQRVYLYSFLGNDLKLTPSSENQICDEACYEVFKRTPAEE